MEGIPSTQIPSSITPPSNMLNSSQQLPLSKPSDSFAVPTININNYVHVKLTKDNYLLWKTMFLHVLQYFELEGHLDGTSPCPSRLTSTGSENPAHLLWIKSDKTLMIWINATLHESVLPYTIGYCSSKQLWDLLETRFASLSKAHIHQLKFKLQNLKKGHLSISEYLQAIKSVAYSLAAAGSPILDDDIVSYTLNGLTKELDMFSTSVRIRSDSISSEELHNLLLSEEINLQGRLQEPSESTSNLTKAFAATNIHSGGSSAFPNYGSANINPSLPSNNYSSPGRGRGRGRSNQTSSSRNQGYGSRNTYPNKPFRFSNNQSSSIPQANCQICQRPNHNALDCHYKMNYQFVGRIPPPKLQVMAAKSNYEYQFLTSPQQPSYSPWLADTGANQHITNDLSNISTASPYTGSGKVYVGDGTGSLGEDAFSRDF